MSEGWKLIKYLYKEGQIKINIILFRIYERYVFLNNMDLEKFFQEISQLKSLEEIHINAEKNRINKNIALSLI